MGVYVSLSPKTTQALIPDDLARELATVGFTVRAAYALKNDTLREIQVGSEPAFSIYMIDDRGYEIEIDRNRNFTCGCAAWWRFSWGTSAESYSRELLHLLGIAEQLDWELHGNSGKLVTRENFAIEVMRYGGVAVDVLGMLGTVSPPQPPKDKPKLPAEFNELIDAMILKSLERMAREAASESGTDESPGSGDDS